MASQHGGQLGNNIPSRTEEVLQSDQRKAWKKGKAGLHISYGLCNRVEGRGLSKNESEGVQGGIKGRVSRGLAGFKCGVNLEKIGINLSIHRFPSKEAAGNSILNFNGRPIL